MIHMLGGETGLWTVTGIAEISGAGLVPASRLDVLDVPPDAPLPAAVWTLRGFPSNQRYANRAEDTALKAIQAPLARADAVCAALIPIRKSERWWAMPQDERRAIFEEKSHHTAIGLDYLPGVARRLIHCRDIGEPFDFLTWFEFAPEHEAAFDELLRRLRGTAEWGFVERECEVRLRPEG